MTKVDIRKEIEILPGVEVNLNLPEIEVSGEKGKLSREFRFKRVKIEKKDQKIILESKNAAKKEKAMLNTFAAHINNMMKGVTEGFTYLLKICSGHFPMTVHKEGNKVVIKNFLGERVPRVAKIPENVNLEIKKDEITITGYNKERLGEAAANLERATIIKGRDRRKFQDGIYLVSKAGKTI